MTVAEAGTIDFIAHDQERDEILLVMVEDRAWGESGALLPDLQAKFNFYLDYVMTGQFQQTYSTFGEHRVHIQVRSVDHPGPRELEFLRIMAEQHLAPLGIRLSFRMIGGDQETEVKG